MSQLRARLLGASLLRAGLLRAILLPATALIILALSACNLPTAQQTPTQSGASLLYTAAAQTVEAQMTQLAQPPAGTQPGFTPLAPTNTPVTLVPPSPTPQPPTATTRPTSTPLPCDLAEFVKDVSYPDNTNVAAGETFVKTWRLKNAGTCTWTTEYDLVFSGGDAMSAPNTIALPGSVAPGQTLDLSVTLTAPGSTGTYRGDFKLRNAANVVFGLGDGTKPFWVQIKVKVATGLLFDFLVNADDAKWVSGVSTDPGVDLTFGGDINNPEGVAAIVNKVKQEDGSNSAKVLLTAPKQQNDGFIFGTYPSYTVQSGDHFKARLGFMLPEGVTSCQSGKVKFQLSYQEGDSVKLIKEWSKSCDGKFVPVDVDLSGLKGKTVRFILHIEADGDSSGDWAIWSSPRVEQ